MPRNNNMQVMPINDNSLEDNITLFPTNSAIKVSSNNFKNGRIPLNKNNQRTMPGNNNNNLGVDISSNGRMEKEVYHRIGEGRKAAGALRCAWKKRRLSMGAKMGM